MTLGWLSSRRYLTSRIADMSRPSLNCPTLIFLMATRRPVVFSRAGTTTDGVQQEDEEAVAGETDPCTRRHMYPPLGSAIEYMLTGIARTRVATPQKRTNLGFLQPFNPSQLSRCVSGKRPVSDHSPPRLSLSVGLLSSVHDPNCP